MGMRFRVLAGWLVAVWLLCLSGCSSSNSTASPSTGALFVSTQGDSLVSPFTIDLSKGTIATNGKGIAAGPAPSAMIMVPSGNALFIANSNPAITPTIPPSPCTLPTNLGTVTAYMVQSDGTLMAVSGSSTTGYIPLSMATDSGGHFLFVANQGLQCAPASGTISVFSIQSTTLTEVQGSPFRTAAPLASSGTGPSAVAVTPDGKFLYVANQFDATVAQYSVDASGVLTQESTKFVGTAPSALAITPDGGFLYVSNAGSSNVSAFAICGKVVTSCADPTSPDGRLSAVSNSPFSAGLAPAFIVTDSSGKFLFVVDRLSNQVSQYKISTGTGELTADALAAISTGLNPVWATVRNGNTVIKATGGTTNFLYVANLGSSSISVYSFDSTVGLLGLVGGPVSTGGSPAAIAVK
jgi:6-phosphogluconolactonase (cycloisomerase 2 family)